MKYLQEKDNVIKRLQTQIEVTKLYSQRSKKDFQPDQSGDHNKIRLKIPEFQRSFVKDNRKKDRSLSWTPGLQEADSTLIGEMGESNIRSNDYFKGKVENLVHSKSSICSKYTILV